MNHYRLRKLILSALFLALCLVLPFITGQIPNIGAMLSPMHIPVFLAGMICGPVYGAVVGAVAPILRFFLFSMPPIFPTGTAMAFELAAYGAVSGLAVRMLPKKNVFVYVALIVSMIAGRIVWGIAQTVLLAFSGSAFAFQAFLAGAFINAWPGIVLHILIIPPIVMALKRAGLITELE